MYKVNKTDFYHCAGKGKEFNLYFYINHIKKKNRQNMTH